MPRSTHLQGAVSLAVPFLAPALMLALAAGACPRSACGDEPLNLLRHAEVRTERTSELGEEAAALARITDGDPETAAMAAAREAAPLEILFGFGGATMTAESLVVRLPGEPTVKVDLLVSTISGAAGFKSVTAPRLEGTAEAQEFSFPPVAARWLLLRFTPASEAGQLALAEVEVRGYEGPPRTRYEFKQSPAAAFDVLGRLQKSAWSGSVSKDEAALFEDARDGRFDKWSLTEALLIASGVKEAARRKAYLKQVGRLEAQARKRVAGAKSPFAKGQRLLAWLHEGPFDKGYQADQTDVSKLLDTSQFNCVSSCAVYNMLGSRLDLDLRAIEVPDHVFSILYDGTRHADVECTTAAGFNPARDPDALQQFEKQTGFSYIPESHRDQRREIGETGLAAIIYYNHGVRLTEDEQFPEALGAYFRALSLDPEFDSAVKNVLAVLANWPLRLAAAKEFEKALEVVDAGLALAPDDYTLKNNHIALWDEWVQAAAQDDNDRAVEIASRATARIPAEAEHFAALQAWVFVRRGQELAERSEWEQALSAVEPGVDKLSDRPLAELRDWRAGLFLRWSQAEMEQHRYEQAAQALRRGMAIEPSDTRLAGQLVYVVQAWLRHAHETQGEASAKERLLASLQEFGDIEGIKDVAVNHVRWAVKQHLEKGDFAEAAAAVERYNNVLEKAGSADTADEMIAYSAQEWVAKVYETDGEDSARQIMLSLLSKSPVPDGVKDVAANHVRRLAQQQQEKGDYAAAVAAVSRHRELLEKAGKEDDAGELIAYYAQEWAAKSLESDGEAAARKVLFSLLKQFPKLEDVKEVSLNHVRRAVGALRDESKWDEALAALDRHRKLLAVAGHGDEAESISVSVIDARGHQLIDKKEWAEAIQVYEKGLKIWPDSGVLQNNLNYCRQEQGK